MRLYRWWIDPALGTRPGVAMAGVGVSWALGAIPLAVIAARVREPGGLSHGTLWILTAMGVPAGVLVTSGLCAIGVWVWGESPRGLACLRWQIRMLLVGVAVLLGLWAQLT